MKTIIRLPTEQFAYIEQEVEADSPEEAVAAYHALAAAYKGNTNAGLPPKSFNATLDEYMTTGTIMGGSELYAQMNPQQQGILQAVKLSMKRIKNKSGEPEIE